MVVTRTIEYEIDDYLGEDLIDNTLNGDDYIIGVDDKGGAITYCDLDVENQIIFLKALQEQINTKIAQEINLTKEKIKTAATE